jgi:serine/threonine protein kinase
MDARSCLPEQNGLVNSREHVTSLPRCGAMEAVVGESSYRLLARGREGKVLRGKWRLVKLLGCGGTGAVYEGAHRNGFRAAIKILHTHLADNPESRTRFSREARTTNRLRHPAVLRFYDEDTDDNGAPFLVMELLRGENCESRLQRLGPLAPTSALRIAEVVLSVLESAHPRGILHRDIKPQNVFLTEQHEIKLVDFGLARNRLRSKGPRQSETLMTAFVVGTPAFMAPEQLRGEFRAIDERTDLWAVGALLFTLLTNQWPDRFDLVELSRTGDRKLPPLRTLLPGAPASLHELVDRALKIDPGERWPSAREMRVAARDAARACRRAAQPRPPLPRAALLGAATLSAALGAFGAMIFSGATPEPPAPAPPLAASVSLSLHVSPPSASLLLDGKPLPGNPYRGQLAKDGQEHEFQARAPGYAPKARILKAQSDLEVDLQLEPLSPGQAVKPPETPHAPAPP